MDLNDGRVVSNFVIQALQGKEITIYGDGSQSRSFCFVDDLIEGFIKVMDLESLDSPINLGNPTEFTILELAQLIIKMTKSKSKISFKDLPEDDPKQRKPDISFAREKIAWNPSVDLSHGLEKTIAYFKKVI